MKWILSLGGRGIQKAVREFRCVFVKVWQHRRIGIVYPVSISHFEYAKTLLPYVEGILELGLGYQIYCIDASINSDVSVSCHGIDDLQSPEFWKRQSLDFVLEITWPSGYIEVTRALARAKIPNVVKLDSDGRLTCRLFPRYFFDTMVRPQKNMFMKSRAMFAWIRGLLRNKSFVDVLIEKIEISSGLTIETHSALENLERVLKWVNRPDLIGKVKVVPYPLTSKMSHDGASLLRKRTPLQVNVISVARWDDYPQKNTRAYERILSAYLRQDTSSKVILLGSHADREFANLSRQFPGRVETGSVSRSEIPQYLKRAHIFLTLSRWESFQIAVFEALAFGCSVVGPAITPVLEASRCPGFGQRVPSFSDREILNSLHVETARWREGNVSSDEIARFWSRELAPAPILEKIIAAAGFQSPGLRRAG